MSVCGAIYLQGVAHRTADCGLHRTMADIIYYSSKSKGEERNERECGQRRSKTGRGRAGEQESRREESNHEAWRGCCGRRSFQSISFVIVIDIL